MKTKKVIALLIVVVLIMGCCVVPASAAEGFVSEPDEWVISDQAGENGYYEFSQETKSVEYVSPTDVDEADYDFIAAEVPGMSENDEEVTPFSVIGRDQRMKVTDPTGRYASTCLIAARFGPNDDDVFKGTGWLLNDSYLVTAGHMLYDDHYSQNGNNGFALHVAVYVGASGGKYKQYRKGYKYDVGAGYVDSPTSSGSSYLLYGIRDDWGIVKLESPLTVNVGHLGRRKVSNASDMTGSQYYVQGYPGDLNEGVSPWSKYYMYVSYGQILEDNTLNTVYTDLDTGEGMSGGPVYRYDSNLGYCVEAIHVYGDPYGVHNTAVLISQDLWNIIAKVTK